MWHANICYWFLASEEPGRYGVKKGCVTYPVTFLMKYPLERSIAS